MHPSFHWHLSHLWRLQVFESALHNRFSEALLEGVLQWVSEDGRVLRRGSQKGLLEDMVKAETGLFWESCPSCVPYPISNNLSRAEGGGRGCSRGPIMLERLRCIASGELLLSAALCHNEADCFKCPCQSITLELCKWILAPILPPEKGALW